jgi:hypothetical protein
VQLKGLGQLKNPMTSSGIKPTTFGLGAVRWLKFNSDLFNLQWFFNK